MRIAKITEKYVVYFENGNWYVCKRTVFDGKYGH